MQFLIDVTLTLFYILGFLLICAWTWRFWKMYINQKFLNKLQSECILLEVKLPRDVFKSPYAMEATIASFLQSGGVGTWYDRNFKGQLLTYFSLEIASIEGIIHFYIRTQKKFRPLIESNLYAQYPGIEVVVADDYTSAIRYHHLSNDVDLWAVDFDLAKKWTPTDANGEKLKKDGSDYKMPADYLPIKTYVDYGLDKDPKEEYKNDPLVPLLEFMGSVGKGEYVWYHILLQDDGKYDDKTYPKSYVNEVTHEHYNMADMANKRKAQLRTGKIVKKGDLVYDDYGYARERDTGKKDEAGNAIREPMTYQKTSIGLKKDQEFTQEEKDELELINRKLSKPVLRGCVRLMYIAKKEHMDFNNIPTVMSIMRPFGSNAGNSFAPGTVCDPYSFPWENTMKKRTPWRKEEMFEAFVERELFYPHIPQRDGIDKSEDLFFWNFNFETRKKWRMLYESIFHPFDHPHPSVDTFNLEELATLWHLPGAVASVPELARIDSAKGVPPLNLPQ